VENDYELIADAESVYKGSDLTVALKKFRACCAAGNKSVALFENGEMAMDYEPKGTETDKKILDEELITIFNNP
jgi:hypothetical protein